MRHNQLAPYGFTDVGPYAWDHPANAIIRNIDIASYKKIIETADMYSPGEYPCRPVVFEDSAGNKYPMKLVPYRHPSGAATITLGTFSTASDGTRTYTPTHEGRMLNEAGVLIAPTEEAEDVAGMLFTDYYYSPPSPPDVYESARASTIAAGDFLWLVREGDVELDASGAVADNTILISSTTVAGEVEAAPAINTGGSIADYNGTLLQNLLGHANPRAFGLAISVAAIGAAGRVRCRLQLPPRYHRTH